jgi:uncharacterized circularly permuted ATP-grasp superfamily protein
MMKAPGNPRSHYENLHHQLNQFSMDDSRSRHELAQQSFLRRGISFTVYDDKEQGTERTMPFDFVPNIIPRQEWSRVEKGLIQRVKALNAFLEDVYSEQQILHDGIVPRDLIVDNPYFCPQIAQPNYANRNHIFLAGIDLIREAR